MATIAISTDHVGVTNESSGRGHWPDLRFGVLLVSALTVLAVGIQGYHPYAEDGGLYLAGVERVLDPALFPHDAAFLLEPMRFSLFAPALATLVRAAHSSLPQMVLLLHLATIWMTLFAGWMLAARCWTNRNARAGAVVLLACWLSLPVAGTALVLMDPYLTARSISTPCMVFALVAILDATSGSMSPRRGRALWLCFAALAIAAAVHPLMAGYALGAVLVLVCLRRFAPRIRAAVMAVLPVAALALAGVVYAVARPESPEYTQIALSRTYWFPSLWSWCEWIGLAAPLAILGFFVRSLSSPRKPSAAHRALAQMAMVCGFTACMVAFGLARPGATTYVVARLQPLRVFQIVYLILTLTLGAKLGEVILKRSGWRWAVAILVLAGTMHSAMRRALPYSPHLELPTSVSHNPWVQAFAWIRDNTPKDALFALDADYIHSAGEDAQCFRSIAERSALPDYSKDGGEASIAPYLTPAWVAGQKAQQGLNASGTTDAMRQAKLGPRGVTWVVLNAETATQLTCAYRNSTVKVCRL